MLSESDVFISYATDTKPEAEELARALERHGIQAWADFKDLRPGQRWQEEIERAVESADLFLILVGRHSSATPRLEAEWRAALANAWSDSQKTSSRFSLDPRTRLLSFAVGCHCESIRPSSQRNGPSWYLTLSNLSANN